jgi:hypothetical protein
MIMKPILLVATLLSLTVANPVTNPVQTAPALGNCECKRPICPLELVAVSFLPYSFLQTQPIQHIGQECKCKAAAALECYEKKTAEGLQCPYPMLTVSHILALRHLF